MDPFVAEIRIFGFNFAPKGWAFCNGKLMAISQNTALFSLLGTTYGGDGKSTFALPDLQGRSPMFYGQGPGLSYRDIGETAGEETVTLLQTEIPAHSHALNGVNDSGLQSNPGGAFPARANIYKSNPGGSPVGANEFFCSSANRQQSTAQQHATLLNAQHVHCVTGRFPAAWLICK